MGYFHDLLGGFLFAPVRVGVGQLFAFFFFFCEPVSAYKRLEYYE